MLLFFGIMALGFGAGWFLRDRPRLVSRVGGLTRPVILALLFLMGLTIGLDDRTMANLGAIGLSSLGFALLTSLGSMLVLALVTPLLGDVLHRSPGAPPGSGADTAILAQAEAEGEALGK